MNIKDKIKEAKPILTALVQLERKHGAELTHYAMRRRLAFVSEEAKRVQAIEKMEKELVELRKRR